MNIGDLIYSIITLILMVLIIMSPLLRKIFRSAEKNVKGDAKVPEDEMYESVDSHRVVNRLLEEMEMAPHMEFIEPDTVKPTEHYAEEKRSSSLKRIENLPNLKRAVIWSEILSKPVGLKDPFKE